MDLTAVMASLLRRWYVVVAGVLVGGALVVAALQFVPPSYSAAGSMLLLPPQADVKEGTNPLLQLGGLEQPASLAVAYLSASDVQQKFGEDFPGALFTVQVDPLSRGPLVVFTTEAPTPDGAISSLRGAVELLPDALQTLQDNVDAPQESRVRAVPLTIDERATIVRGSTLRAAILAGGAGLVLAFAGAVALDSLLVRRASRRSGRRRSTPGEARGASSTTAADEPTPAEPLSAQWAQQTAPAPQRR
ncbi:hypothetical protein [Cellulomonas sp. ICMP 17802]|uniref:hypothetical protein n=1 Tax=Cellulomonas sp. ICMP 17802 TaxID=3239199 RepID=UPI00351AE922